MYGFSILFALPLFFNESHGFVKTLSPCQKKFGISSANLSSIRKSFLSKPNENKFVALSHQMSSEEAAPVPEIPEPLKQVEALKESNSNIIQNLKILGYFTLWFALNAYYNISNKKTLNMVSIPWILSSAQLVVGSIYVSLIWLLKIRPAPKISKEAIKAVFPLAAFHTTSHISAVIGLGAGAVGFFHIVKSLEPLFTASINAALFQVFLPIPVALSLLPVVGGVALASMKELSFSWVSFMGAMGSNICAASRGVFAKRQMGKTQLPNLDPGNLYGLTTIIAALLLTPAALIVEGSKLKSVLKAAELAGHTTKAIIWGMVMSGLYFYTYNEVAFYCLGNIDATTHAVGNTVKRVILLCVSVLVFGHKLTPLGLAGSATAILGVLIYSLLKNKYAEKAKKV